MPLRGVVLTHLCLVSSCFQLIALLHCKHCLETRNSMFSFSNRASHRIKSLMQQAMEFSSVPQFSWCRPCDRVWTLQFDIHSMDTADDTDEVSLTSMASWQCPVRPVPTLPQHLQASDFHLDLFTIHQCSDIYQVDK